MGSGDFFGYGGNRSDLQYPFIHRIFFPEHDGKSTPQRPASTNASDTTGFHTKYNTIPTTRTTNIIPACSLIRISIVSISFLQYILYPHSRMENNTQSHHPNVIFTFGRFNPPTIGHEMMIQKVIQEAKETNADAYMVLSHSQNATKNPLFVEEKLNMMANIFPNKESVRRLRTYPAQANKQRLIGDIVREFCEKYDTVTMVVGSDRVDDFTWLRDGHLKKNGTRGIPICPKLIIKSAGERNDTKNNISRMSASKVREAALRENMVAVRTGIPLAISNEKVNDVMTLIQTRIKTKKRKPNTQPSASKQQRTVPPASGGKRARKTRRHT